jgi:hypothetical protein
VISTAPGIVALDTSTWAVATDDPLKVNYDRRAAYAGGGLPI